ncbi:delphilin-like isoform X2 [Ptychodera flava]|uniref:delphilin-like isoform X2 n=1 Tax=Ptychodera flava TaxID=63121 RepID=UPI003969ECBD
MKYKRGKKMEPMSATDRNQRTKDFFRRVDQVLYNEPAKKEALLSLLKQYARDKKIERLTKTLVMLLNSQQQKQLLYDVRIFIPPMHRDKYDAIITGMSQNPQMALDTRQIIDPHHRKKVIRITRTNGIFGFTLSGQNPVYVESIDPGGPAMRAGLMPGDKILELNGLDVRKKSHKQLIDLLKGSGSTPTVVVQPSLPPPSFHDLQAFNHFTYQFSPSIASSDTASEWFPDIQPIQQTHLRPSASEELTISGVSRQQLVNEGRSLREMLQHHLIPSERMLVKKALQTYADTRNLDGLIIDIFPVLDTPAKKGVWYYIIQLLPSDQQVACWRKVLHLMDRHFSDKSYGGTRRKGLQYSPWQAISHPEEQIKKSSFSSHRSGRYDVTPSRGDVIYRNDKEFVPVAIAAALLDLEKKEQSHSRKSLPFFKESPMLLRNQRIEIHDVTSDSDITPSNPVPYEYDTRRREVATLTDDHETMRQYQQRDLQASAMEDLTIVDSMQRGQRVTAVVHAQQHVNNAAFNGNAGFPSDSDNLSYHSTPRSSKSSVIGSEDFPIAVEPKLNVSNITVAEPQTIYQERHHRSPTVLVAGSATYTKETKHASGATYTRERKHSRETTCSSSPVLISSRTYVTNIDDGVDTDNSSDSSDSDSSDSSQTKEYVFTINESQKSRDSERSSTSTPTITSVNITQHSQSSERSVDNRLDDLLHPDTAVVGKRLVIMNEMHHTNTTEHGNNNNNATSTSSIPDAPPLPIPPPLPGDEPQEINMRVKRINWEKVSNTQNTIWGQLVHEGEDDLNEVVRQLDLEEQFSTDAKKAVVGPQSQKKEQLKILDPKKAYNISILLAHSRMSAEEITTALLTMDEGKLVQAHLQQLHTFSPSDEEIVKLQKVGSGEKHLLSKPDQFALEISSVPQFKVRLQGLIFKSNFSEKHLEIESALDCLKRASSEVRASRKLAKILELVLVMGNYMNQGNRRVGNASGFKISLLPELDTTKTTDNKSTFLHVLAKAVHDKVPAVLSFSEELPNVPTASKISNRTLVTDIQELKNTLTEITATLQSSKSDEQTTTEDKFYEVMDAATQDASDKIGDLCTSQTKVMQDYNNTVEFFGEDPKSMSSDTFFKIFADFITKFDKAHKENLLRPNKQISIL